MIDPARLEYIEGRLVDEDDQAAWERTRSVDLGYADRWVSHGEMVRGWAAERAALEREWAEADERQRERWRRGWVAQVAVERQRSNQQQHTRPEGGTT